ncbi:MAG TPA: Cna B-type domain-containing protein [Lachnospiraceae bacterium]
MKGKNLERKIGIYILCALMFIGAWMWKSKLEVFADANTGALYLDGKNGDDTKDAKSPENAVKSFEKAKELASANPDIQTIYIKGTVKIAGDISLEGTNAILKREASFKGYLLSVAKGSTATLSNVIIDGNSQEAKNTENSLVYVEGVLNIKEGAVLQNNVLTDLGYFRALGGAINTDGTENAKSTINMEGGIIQNNTANMGGAIFLNYGNLNMSGGTIQGNRAVDGSEAGQYGMAAGGGVTIYQGSNFQLSGGSIQNNDSANAGGGVSLGTGVGGNHAYSFEMTGGTIEGNSAGSGGGGILVQAGAEDAYGTANISGGSIINNKMTGLGSGNNAFGGGGIYVNGYSKAYAGFHNGVLHLTNALIADNTAAMEGGGYASCPNSETHIYVKNGVALYGNHADSAKEIYILASNGYGAHSGDPTYEISPLMLGGSPYHWKYQDGSEVPLNKLSGQLMAINNESLSLSTEVNEDANAKALSKVLISGNESATRGAGIGSNGTIYMGESELTSIAVKKTWENDEAGNLPEKIEVELYRAIEDDKENAIYVGYESVQPNEKGEWNLTFTNLPKNDGSGRPYLYSVKERPMEGYKSEVSGDQDQGYNIVNKQVVTISGKKQWVDEDNKAGERPSGITVRLLSNGKEVAIKEVTQADGWSYSFDNLPIYENGQKVTYTIKEDAVKGYTTKIQGYDIVNTYQAEKTEVRVVKVWADKDNKDKKRPDKISVQLYADGNAEGSPIELNKENQWAYTWGNLDKKKAGAEIVYTVDELSVPDGYSKAIDGNAKTGYTITNTHTPNEPKQPPKKPNKEPKKKPISKKVSPKTGDESPLAVYFAVCPLP